MDCSRSPSTGDARVTTVFARPRPPDHPFARRLSATSRKEHCPHGCKQATARRRPAASHKWVYLFDEGSADSRNLLGGKGAGCASMTQAGLPVPPGFTITTEACVYYYSHNNDFPDGLWDQTLTALANIEQKMGKKLGDPNDPLLVSVRSGARVSMPGMMDTVLNLGLNDTSVEGLVQADQQPALRAGRLPPLHQHVRADRAGDRPDEVRSRPGRGEGEGRRQDRP